MIAGALIALADRAGLALAQALAPREDAPPIPLDPDEAEARDLVVLELAKPEYQTTEPTLWDRLMHELGTWFNGLFEGDGSGLSAGLGVVAVLAGLLIVTLVLWLLLRNVGSVARSAIPAEPERAFLDDDRRSVAELRAAAAQAAAQGQWALAVEEQYRALARALADRTIIALRPGSTARDAGRAAALAFPGRARELEHAAIAFDGARYLDLPASEAQWRAIHALDGELERSRPERRVGLRELAALRGGIR